MVWSGAVSIAGGCILDNQSGHRRKSRVRRRVDAVDDRAFYRAWAVLYDFVDRTYAGIGGCVGSAGSKEDIDGQDRAFCPFLIVGHGNGSVAIGSRRRLGRSYGYKKEI